MGNNMANFLVLSHARGSAREQPCIGSRNGWQVFARLSRDKTDVECIYTMPKARSIYICHRVSRKIPFLRVQLTPGICRGVEESRMPRRGLKLGARRRDGSTLFCQ